ncbi:snf2 family helicase [Venturia nashicola]|uniref:Snf2 family helicase n=1 Tax=Venturia nashicola TaxID=86259 RepID=A0A4Z1PX40_9PEZI|nr:snf2 family helicase [Venturia nashicola]TLD39528.1 snf2 family helicase [Venturia nashicola]
MDFEIAPGHTASLHQDVKSALLPSRPFANKYALSASADEASLPSRQDNRDLGTPLESYIALGVIASSITVPASVEPSSSWNEVQDPASFAPALSGSFLKNIQKLYNANWIRATCIVAPFRTVLFRFYLLPDDVAQATVDRESKSLRSLLAELASRCNISPALWHAQSPDLTKKFDIWATGIDRSLFWMFNQLPSPDPTDEDISDRYSRIALNELLDDEPQVPGLKAKLYRYQARSSALMIQKETSPKTHLDPRFEARMGPDGKRFYYNARESTFRQEAPQYESIRGGILAESMGLGKTIMCLALILATKHHLPRIPPHRMTGPRVRERVGTLAQMAAATANSAAVSLKAHFRWVPRFRDIDMSFIAAQIDEEHAGYEIPSQPRRSARRNVDLPPPRKLALCSATIIVVPRNLLHQWQAEFQKHVKEDEDGLRVLVVESNQDQLPSARRLMNYDVILFSKSRFEAEVKDGVDDRGRNATNVRAGCQCPYIGASRIRDCCCFKPDDVYCSPLKQLHFLRIIVDEGHEFSSTATNAVRVATKLVTAERRWVVSGTPAKERLFGVDVDLASNVEAEELAPLLEQERDTATPSSNSAAMEERLIAALDRRKVFSKAEESNGAAKSIGILAANFLGVQPWSGSDNGQKIEWEDYAFRHESNKRTHTAFSGCMAMTLENLVVKTRPEDVSKDVTLPPLDHKVKFLEPSFYDTLTINLFILVITGNAVTSEREDVDYLFHPKAVAARHSLIQNLRRSAFFWTGWSSEDIQGAIDIGERYLLKEGTKASEEDRRTLKGCLKFARMVLKSPSWNTLSLTHELGIFVDSWLEGSESRLLSTSTKAWSLNGDDSPSMIGGTQLKSAQRLINEQLFDENPVEGLEALGIAETAGIIAAGTQERKKDAKKKKDAEETKIGVPLSALQGGGKLNSNFSPTKRRSKAALKDSQIGGNKSTAATESTSRTTNDMSAAPAAEATIRKVTKRKRSDSVDQRDLPADSPLSRPSLIGTVSSKVSYLLSRIMALQQEEKILIFYDSDNTAWYLAQCLELMHVKHLIYSRHLRTDLRSKYVVTFDTDDSVRVLLMDLAHGAWGLNINKASRVFFVNPPFKPHTEAQAIKRAHRIGQTKPVFVETLILRGTVEEAIYERSRAMTREEHDQAGKEISDDKGVADIIKNAKRIDIRAEHGVGIRQMAPLETPLQIFGRPGRGDLRIEGIDKVADFNSGQETKKSKKRQKKVEA